MTRIVSRLAIGLISAGFAVGSASAQGTANLPDYLSAITGHDAADASRAGDA